MSVPAWAQGTRDRGESVYGRIADNAFRSDADADVLADYVLALLRHDGDIATVRRLCEEEIPDFLKEGKETSLPAFDLIPNRSSRQCHFHKRSVRYCALQDIPPTWCETCASNGSDCDGSDECPNWTFGDAV